MLRMNPLMIFKEQTMRQYLAITIIFLCISGTFARNLFRATPTVDSLPVFHNYEEIRNAEPQNVDPDFETIITDLRQVQNNVLIDENGIELYIPICIYKHNGVRFLLYTKSNKYYCFVCLASLDSDSEFPPVLCIFTYNFDKSLQYKLSAYNTIIIETCKEDGDTRIPYKSSVYKLDRNFTKVK